MADEVLKMEARMENFISKEMDRIQNDLKKFKGQAEKSFKEANTASAQFRKGVKSLKSGVAQMATGFALGTLAVQGFQRALRSVGDSIRFVNERTMEFGKTMSRVQAIIQPTSKEVASITKRTKQLGESTIFTASQVGSAFTEMGKLGQKANEIIASSEGVLNLAALAQTDMATAAMSTVKTLNQFDLSADNANRVVDVMAKSFNTTALDMEKFANSMKFVGSIGGSTGESVEQVTGALGVMADRGIEASLAGTSLRRIMLEFANENSKANKTIQKYNKNATTMVEKLKTLRDANVDITEITRIFGLRAVTAGDVLIKNADAVEKLGKEFEGAEGTAKKFADTMLNNVYGDTVKLKSAQEALGIAIGEAFASSKRERIQLYTKLILRAKDAIVAHRRDIEDFAKSLSTVITFFVKAGAGLLSIMGQIGDSINLIWFSVIEEFWAMINNVGKGINFLGGLVGKEDFMDLTFVQAQMAEFGEAAQTAADNVYAAWTGRDFLSSLDTDIKKALEKASKVKTSINNKEGGGELTEEELAAIKKAAKDRYIIQQQEVKRIDKLFNESEKRLREYNRRKEELQQQVVDAEQLFRDARIEAIANDEIRELSQLEVKYDNLKLAVGTNEDALTVLYKAKLQERANIIDNYAEKRVSDETRREQETAANIVRARKSLAGSLTTLAKLAISESKASAKAKQKILLGIAIAETAASVVTAAKAGWDSGGGNVYAGAALAVAAGIEAAALGAVEIASIASQKFASGGIVGGNSVAGDHNIVAANSGEMVLTKMQQAELFNLANNQGSVNNNTSALQLTINLAGGGTVDVENTDRIVESMQVLNDTLLEASRGGYLQDFKEDLKLEL